MLKSSYFVENGTIITPLLLFDQAWGLFAKKSHRFVQYTPKNCPKNFVQSAVTVRREGDGNTISSVVTEIMQLLANNSYGYQIINWSRNTATKYLSDEETYVAINNKIV